jgi:hypothetical protein
MILYNYMNDETERQEKQGNLPHTGVPDRKLAYGLARQKTADITGR